MLRLAVDKVTSIELNFKLVTSNVRLRIARSSAIPSGLKGTTSYLLINFPRARPPQSQG
jgi:hypothetical protein